MLLILLVGYNHLLLAADYQNFFNFQNETDNTLKEAYKSKKNNINSKSSMTEYKKMTDSDYRDSNTKLETKINNTKNKVDNFDTDDISLNDINTQPLLEMTQNEKYDSYKNKISEISNVKYDEDLREREIVKDLKGNYNQEKFDKEAEEYKTPYKYTNNYKEKYANTNNNFKSAYDKYEVMNSGNIKMQQNPDKNLGFSVTFSASTGGMGKGNSTSNPSADVQVNMGTNPISQAASSMGKNANAIIPLAVLPAGQLIGANGKKVKKFEDIIPAGYVKKFQEGKYDNIKIPSYSTLKSWGLNKNDIKILNKNIQQYNISQIKKYDKSEKNWGLAYTTADYTLKTAIVVEGACSLYGAGVFISGAVSTGAMGTAITNLATSTGAFLSGAKWIIPETRFVMP